MEGFDLAGLSGQAERLGRDLQELCGVAALPAPPSWCPVSRFVFPAVCTENLNPGIVVMESAEDGERFDASGPLNRARNRRIFVQRPMRSDVVVIACVGSQNSA